MNSNTIPPDSVMPKKHGIALVKRVIWYDNPKETPPIFVWINRDILLDLLVVIYNRGIDEVLEWEIVIKEWDPDCSNFYLLLSGTLEICLGDICVADINKWSVVWEMWFIGESSRTATVKAKEKSYLLTLDRTFIESLPIEDQLILSKNITKDVIAKLRKTTQKARGNWKSHWWSGKTPYEITREIHDKYGAVL